MWKKREVKVGRIGVGGGNPIRIQSMTTSNTRDAAATVEQIMRLADRGCEIVRVTVQGIKEAETCGEIKNSLLQKGLDIPLVADIHFYPPAAMLVADFVDKVRINPGNFLDRRASFKKIEYDDRSYQEEIARIEEGFSPLVEKCKRNKLALRIGTNHGSLSDRIMNRYGDTPQGMVESALEFARVCRKLDFHNIIFSMKASNPLVMIEAYRLLVRTMIELGWDYPLHLGVTEAGEGEDGRVKSAVGIGSLLLDGIGDTIRVSLTEDPWEEIDPCKRLVALAKQADRAQTPPFKYERVASAAQPFHPNGSVFLPLSPGALQDPALFQQLGCKEQLGRFHRTPATVDAVCVREEPPRAVQEQLLQSGIGVLSNIRALGAASAAGQALLVSGEEGWDKILAYPPSCVLLAFPSKRIELSRRFAAWMRAHALTVPTLLHFRYDLPFEDLVIAAAAECGSLLVDGIGEGIALQAFLDPERLRTLSFQILQAARLRNFKTEFISCPGCGRTLFNLQEVSRRIRARTEHLPGVKIAIMGCIVNGPGEMADADFGYVGSKSEMVDLYVGKTCVERNIPFDQADDRLIELIKSNNKWKDPDN